jgi:hypothetical protein
MHLLCERREAVVRSTRSRERRGGASVSNGLTVGATAVVPVDEGAAAAAPVALTDHGRTHGHTHDHDHPAGDHGHRRTTAVGRGKPGKKPRPPELTGLWSCPDPGCGHRNSPMHDSCFLCGCLRHPGADTERGPLPRAQPHLRHRHRRHCLCHWNHHHHNNNNNNNNNNIHTHTHTLTHTHTHTHNLSA